MALFPARSSVMADWVSPSSAAKAASLGSPKASKHRGVVRH